MRLTITGTTTVHAPAAQVWRVLAHEFDRIGEWASAIPRSHAAGEGLALDGAPVCGRVCSPAVRGFGAVHESFTHYDEAGMRFAYAATAGLPAFVSRAENHWSVRPRDAGSALVEARALVEVRPLPGIVLLPALWVQLRLVANQTLEELAYVVERDAPHPRKLAAMRGRAAPADRSGGA